MGSKIVIFNVGGTRYEESQTLLDQYPESMLAKSASKEWCNSEEKEVFIERNGRRFQFVLDLMRDGRVILPVTQAKAAILAELEYFNLNFESCDIDDSASKCQLIPFLLEKRAKDMSNWTEKYKSNMRRDNLILFCHDRYFSRSISSYECNAIYEDQKVSSLLINASDIDAANKVLREIGIKVKAISSHRYNSKSITIGPLSREELESDMKDQTEDVIS